MDWISLIHNILRIGIVISAIIAVIGYELIKLEIKNPKNYNKVLKDTSIEKYIKIKYIGLILIPIFQLISSTIEIIFN